MCTSDKKLLLKKRLKHLEEETRTMEKEILQNTAERKTLMKDLHQQLKLIQFSLHPENQNSRYKCLKVRGKSNGLSQILYEDWNPTVVVRGGSGANVVAVSGPPRSSMSNILRIEYNK